MLRTGAGFRVSDSVFDLPANNTGGSAVVQGFHVDTTPGGVIERCKFRLKPGYTGTGGRVDRGTVEIYQSWLSANANTNVGFGIEAANSTTLWAVGNTFDSGGTVIAGNTQGFHCDNTSTATLVNNIVSGGRGSSHHMAYPQSGTGCFTSAMSTFKNNYWYYTAAGGLSISPNDAIAQVMANANSSGNIIDNSQASGCFDPAATQPDYKLASAGKCVNMGIAQLRRDGTTIASDIDNSTRVLGGTVDIGCSEKE
jgi:hypothetical protein